jgi:DNA-binding LacI/PurR family transcriptional regulator
VDGLLISGPRMPHAKVLEASRPVPTVVVGSAIDGLACVVPGTAEGMHQAVRHLSALGHSRIAYVNGTPASREERQRRLLLDAAEEYGIDVVEQLGPFPLTVSSGMAAADLVLTSKATAAIAHNDLVALGVARGFARLGVSVPDDISLIGVDDTPLAEATHPPLTSVHLPLEEMAVQAVDALLDRIGADGADDLAPPRIVTVPTSLVVRGSTGRARRRS